MNRILSVVTMMVVLAAMMVVMAASAFADPPNGCTPGNSGPGNGFFASDRNCFHPGP